MPQVERTDAPRFRSDQDLQLWLMWGRAALPLTGLSLGGLLHLGVPFGYTPLATLPALLLYLALRVGAWRRRKAGRRFIDYADEDVSW
ncbi:hypothetical protein [Sphingomonas pituitosa]|uniref:hypothetical protein n=1 Tax=Sphingomonas pituitosa TaxID=99597 RepID=UPI000A591CD1|nr:hypothetical protein [Sphingomonas pituitosa]